MAATATPTVHYGVPPCRTWQIFSFDTLPSGQTHLNANFRAKQLEARSSKLARSVAQRSVFCQAICVLGKGVSTVSGRLGGRLKLLAASA